MRLAAIFAILLLLAGTVGAQQKDTDVVAEVTRIKNAAVAMQDAFPRTLDVGSGIQLGDIISTGKGARLEITFDDGTTISLGERTQFSVVEFIVDQNGGNAVMRLLEGAFKATSGGMMQLADSNMSIETKTATIGIRGTTVWGGKLDDVFEVALLDGKAVYVETKAGRVDLNQVGQGTRVQDADATPSAPVTWAAQKIDRASATVSFDN